MDSTPDRVTEEDRLRLLVSQERHGRLVAELRAAQLAFELARGEREALLHELAARYALEQGDGVDYQAGTIARAANGRAAHQ
jgi:hypothetical protein